MLPLIKHDFMKNFHEIPYRFDDNFISNPFLFQEPLFIQKRNSTDYLLDDPVITENNVLLEGFCIDILKAMSRLLKFQYTIYLAPDGKFGSKKKHGWTGMVRELINNVSFRFSLNFRNI